MQYEREEGRLSVIDGDIIGAARLLQPCVLGADAGVVEARGDRVRLFDLPALRVLRGGASITSRCSRDAAETTAHARGVYTRPSLGTPAAGRCACRGVRPACRARVSPSGASCARPRRQPRRRRACRQVAPRSRRGRAGVAPGSRRDRAEIAHLTSLSGTKAWNIPMAFDPPPTQATTTSGSRPTSSSICARASLPITAWKSRTIVGNGCGPMAEPMR